MYLHIHIHIAIPAPIATTIGGVIRETDIAEL